MNLTPLVGLQAVLLQAGDGAPQGSPLGMLVPMGAIFLIFYFLILRPQHKQQRAQEDMRKAAAKGDDVVTVGGVHGRVTGATDDVLTVEIAAIKGERVRIKVDRAKIDRVDKAAKGDE